VSFALLTIFTWNATIIAIVIIKSERRESIPTTVNSPAEIKVAVEWRGNSGLGLFV